MACRGEPTGRVLSRFPFGLGDQNSHFAHGLRRDGRLYDSHSAAFKGANETVPDGGEGAAGVLEFKLRDSERPVCGGFALELMDEFQRVIGERPVEGELALLQGCESLQLGGGPVRSEAGPPVDYQFVAHVQQVNGRGPRVDGERSVEPGLRAVLLREPGHELPDPCRVAGIGSGESEPGLQELGQPQRPEPDRAECGITVGPRSAVQVQAKQNVHIIPRDVLERQFLDHMGGVGQ